MPRRLLAMMFVAMIVPAAAHAAGSFSTWGPQVGFSADPSQAVVGAHMQMGNVAPQIDFVPSADIGFGGDVAVLSLNADLHYRFEVSGATWQPYAGAGAALHFASGDMLGGGSVIVGADVPTQSGSRFFAEAKFGIGDGPSFKMLVGWSFKMR